MDQDSKVSLDVIGAGLCRTGTFSLRKALNELGFAPCYHMHELFFHPEHCSLWRAAAKTHLDSWDSLLRGYRAVADTPACLFWRELAAAYPDAKVVLTVRDAAEWYESVRSTVYETVMRGDQGGALDLSRELVLDGYFRGQFADRPKAISRFREHNDAVRAEVPPERLLVFEVSQGWGPLCEFLGTTVPASAFPNTNTRSQFRERTGLSR